MSMIMIRCPETGSEISTGIECEDADFRSLPFVITQTTCPSCGREHSKRSPDERSDIRVSPASMDRPRYHARRPMRVLGDTARLCSGVRHGLATSALLSRISLRSSGLLARSPDRVGPGRGYAQPHPGAESRGALRLRQVSVARPPLRYCRNWAISGKTRCKFHGGMSTGPRTPEGKRRVVAAMVGGRRRWVERMKAEGRKFPGGRKSRSRMATSRKPTTAAAKPTAAVQLRRQYRHMTFDEFVATAKEALNN
jgi:hypothetical protein